MTKKNCFIIVKTIILDSETDKNLILQLCCIFLDAFEEFQIFKNGFSKDIYFIL